MKYIITETQAQRIKILRRINGEDWEIIRDIVYDGFDEDDPCNYDNKEDYLNSISRGSATVYIFTYLDEKDYGTEIFTYFKELITKLINEKLGEEIIDYYQNKKRYCED